MEDLAEQLKDDNKVKVAGIDADGVLRGKVMAKDKFMSAMKSGFGFCRLALSWVRSLTVAV
jgi:glutamine synthetase